MNREQIRQDLAAWNELHTYYESELEESRKYGNVGQRETAEEMIKFSKQRINELEEKLVKTRKGA